MIAWQDVVDAAEAVGLRTRGGFHCLDADGVPPSSGDSASPAKSLVLLGGEGASLWPVFSGSSEFRDGQADALDRWSRRVITALAENLGGWPLFPFGTKPYLPFLTWAMKSETLFVSPLGMTIHPQAGLWHSYRGAIAFAEQVRDLPAPVPSEHPCEACVDRPCLSACPVAAFADGMYEVEDCVQHLESPKGTDCMMGSCLARRACPVGRGYHYGTDQSAFHMKAFLYARQNARRAG